MGAERERLADRSVGDDLDPPPTAVEKRAWREWGPFVSEREWGTVREDYSADGEAWGSVTHDQARSTAYRWGEDGLAAICDRRQGMCVGLALWNGRDPVLKERLFGLTGKEGNHGEDVKECYWYLDATPTHSWLHWRYHYPQAPFPYEDLVAENARRGYDQPEYELLDTGVFDQGYWAIDAQYAKAGPDDLCLRVRATNHGPARDTLHLLPSIWLRNVWGWGRGKDRPGLRGHAHADGHAIVVDHARLGRWVAIASPGVDGDAEPLFCENETNLQRLYGVANSTPYPKDGINDHVVSHGVAPTVDPEHHGTRSAWWFRRAAEPGETIEVRVRLARVGEAPEPPARPPLIAGMPAARVETVGGRPSGSRPGRDARDRVAAGEPTDLTEVPVDPAEVPVATADLPDLGTGFEAAMDAREAEADEFYSEVLPATVTPAEAQVARRAFAGLLWTQQFYRYDVGTWLDGDPGEPSPPPGRGDIRNGRWRHLDANDVITVPDKWEYPWFASWDLAFHAVSLAHVDPEMAKEQLELLFRVWYQHPNGALPAYEWEFSDANPPVHAWAALNVFWIDGRQRGELDYEFLERIFHKLLLNFTWWVNREDAEGNNVFEGGFLGLDNIGPFNRSEALPVDAVLEQSDGSGWMAMYCLNLLHVSLILAAHNRVYEGVAVKFFEHFSLIAEAMTKTGLWSEEDGFFFDVVRMRDGSSVPLKIRSMVGIVPVVALTVINDVEVAGLDTFLARARWFIEHKPTADSFFGRYVPDEHRAMGMLSVISPDRLGRILNVVLDEDEFLSPYGLRSLSKHHLDHPVSVDLGGVHAEVRYEPGESTSGMFGGNSNWRGPVWFPLNYLFIEKLRFFAQFVGDELTVEYPTGSGTQLSLGAVADDLSRRLVSLFLPDPALDGRRPASGPDARWARPGWDEPLFYEYFHGDTGAGLGASHQTGWTALVANLIMTRPGELF